MRISSKQLTLKFMDQLVLLDHVVKQKQVTTHKLVGFVLSLHENGGPWNSVREVANRKLQQVGQVVFPGHDHLLVVNPNQQVCAVSTQGRRISVLDGEELGQPAHLVSKLLQNYPIQRSDIIAELYLVLYNGLYLLQELSIDESPFWLWQVLLHLVFLDEYLFREYDRVEFLDVVEQGAKDLNFRGRKEKVLLFESF